MEINTEQRMEKAIVSNQKGIFLAREVTCDRVDAEKSATAVDRLLLKWADFSTKARAVCGEKSSSTPLMLNAQR